MKPNAMCRSCAAPLIFARTPAGRLIPLDANRTEAGSVAIVDRQAVVVPKAERAGRLLFMPHHATCPHANRYRKGAKKCT